MFNSIAKVSNRWTKVSDLLPEQNRKPFYFEDGKTYYLYNDSGYTMYFSISETVPKEDFVGTPLLSLNTAGYVPNDSGNLYVRMLLLNQYPNPPYLTLRVREREQQPSEVALGAYVPEVSSSNRGAMMYLKGYVASYKDLPSNPEIGDTYDIQDTGRNVIWNGSDWDEFCPALDLSSYVKRNDFNSLSSKVNDKASFADMDALVSRLRIVEDKVGTLSKTNIEVVATESGTSLNLSDSSKDYIVSGDISESASISGRSVLLKDASISNSTLVLNAENDIEFKSVSLSGSYPNNKGKVIKADNSEYVTIRDSLFDASSCYNMIELGLDGTSLPKSVLIENCKFTGKYSNNAILIFGTQDNAVININNCYFENVSNVVRLSNKANAKNVIVNITNCVCDHWDTTPKWSGLLLCQDYTSGSVDAAIQNNLFAPNKIVINVSNLTMPNGKKLEMPEDMSTICGSATAKQVFYLWDNYRGSVSYNPEVYPSINIM